MTVKIDVKRKLKINGKEYASREEMPEHIRHLYDQALAKSGCLDSENAAPFASKIVFNGNEYESVESMPADVRQLYESFPAAAQGGEADASLLSPGRTKLTETILTQHGHTDWARSDKAIEPASPVKRWSIIGFLIFLGLTILYFLLRQG